MNAGLFEWIDGNNIVIPTDNDIDQICDFISYLKKITATHSHSIQPATEACFSLDELILQIEIRIIRLKKVAHPLLKSFFVDLFDPVFLVAKKMSKNSTKNF